jgi:hypothetical protein
MDRYALALVTNWTPQLSPPPDSPLFRWRVLAGDVPHGGVPIRSSNRRPDFDHRGVILRDAAKWPLPRV